MQWDSFYVQKAPVMYQFFYKPTLTYGHKLWWNGIVNT